MREIKFRGKRVENGEWVHGCFAEFVNYLDGDTKPGIQVTNQVPSGFDRMIPAFETELVEVIPETVGQYTGLKDKNGVEIYEGDVVKGYSVYPTASTFESFLMGEVYYTDRGTWDCYSYILGGFNEQVEVIGNIHENPELMGEKE